MVRPQLSVLCLYWEPDLRKGPDILELGPEEGDQNSEGTWFFYNMFPFEGTWKCLDVYFLGWIWNLKAWVWMLAVLCITSMNLSKSFDLSEPQFPFL